MQAELGGARNMGWFILLFPPLLCLSLFVMVPHAKHRGATSLLHNPALVQIPIWLVIGLIWAPFIKRSTKRALDTAGNNSALVAGTQ